MDEEVEVTVPVQLVGDSPGVREGGVLAQLLWELQISCLPTRIPEAIEVDISGLEIGDTLLVKDISAPEGIEVLTDPGNHCGNDRRSRDGSGRSRRSSWKPTGPGKT